MPERSIRSVRFIEGATEDFSEALAYFHEQSDRARKFREDVEKASAFMVRFPYGAESLDATFRKKRLEHFDYALIYAVLEDEIVIVAVAADKRRPGYWRRRVKSLKKLFS